MKRKGGARNNGGIRARIVQDAAASEDERDQPAAAVDEGTSESLQVNFGKRLAHTDKVVRDRGFRTLRAWLRKHPDLERLEYMKLWKGLYFGMWMSDKRPVQQELCVNTALLINDVPVDKRSMWMDTFWETMTAAWEKLDKYRINKYMLFLRIVVAESFKVLRDSGWRSNDVKGSSESFLRSVPRTTPNSLNVQSIGLLLQFTVIFWEELLPQEPPVETVITLLEPFLALATTGGTDALVQSVHENVLRKAPSEARKALVELVLNSAARPDIQKKNREALYETADVLEKPVAVPAKPAPPVVRTVGAEGVRVSRKARRKARRKAEKRGGGDPEPAKDSLPKAAVTSKKRKASPIAPVENCARKKSRGASKKVA